MYREDTRDEKSLLLLTSSNFRVYLSQHLYFISVLSSQDPTSHGSKSDQSLHPHFQNGADAKSHDGNDRKWPTTWVILLRVFLPHHLPLLWDRWLLVGGWSNYISWGSAYEIQHTLCDRGKSWSTAQGDEFWATYFQSLLLLGDACWTYVCCTIEARQQHFLLWEGIFWRF